MSDTKGHKKLKSHTKSHMTPPYQKDRRHVAFFYLTVRHRKPDQLLFELGDNGLCHFFYCHT